MSHDSAHGTAVISRPPAHPPASIMVMRESIVWRWSHTRHHSDTIIVGRDPEIQISRPPDIPAHVASLVAIGSYRSYFPSVLRHALGGVTDAKRTFIPETEFHKIFP